MKISHITALVLSATALCSYAQDGKAGKSTPAESRIYGELGYTALNHRESGTGYSFKTRPGMVRGIVGYPVHENVDIEGMVGLGLKKGEATVAGKKVEIKPSSMLGLYVKPKVVVGNGVELYGRAGVTALNLKDTRPGSLRSGSSLSWGLGAKYHVNESVALGADYMSYYKRNKVKVDGVTVGVSYQF